MATKRKDNWLVWRNADGSWYRLGSDGIYPFDGRLSNTSIYYDALAHIKRMRQVMSPPAGFSIHRNTRILNLPDKVKPINLTLFIENDLILCRHNAPSVAPSLQLLKNKDERTRS